MPMTLVQVDAAILAQHQSKQTQLEAFYNAPDKPTRQAAKQALSDIEDNLNALNNIRGEILVIQQLGGP